MNIYSYVYMIVEVNFILFWFFSAADYLSPLIITSGIVYDCGNFIITHKCDFSMLTYPAEGL